MWKVGDRAANVEQIDFGKIVKIKVDSQGQTWYLIRDFRHPHDMVWTDETHIEKPTMIQHDDERRRKRGGS